MPKEITYGEHGTFLQTADGREYPEDDNTQSLLSSGRISGKWKRRGVHVGWVRGRTVEVGVAAFDPAKQQPTDGVFLTMDRDGINRLIRSLRRARDSAFGADA